MKASAKPIVKKVVRSATEVRSPAAWTLGDALLFSVKSTISVLRPPAARLTYAGEWTVVLRILGRVLFGLAVLSLRARVER